MLTWLRQLFQRKPTLTCCAQCRYFDNHPRTMELESPGLSSLSSGYGAVRGGDGQCSRHQRYVAPMGHCQDFDVKVK